MPAWSNSKTTASGVTIPPAGRAIGEGTPLPYRGSVDLDRYLATHEADWQRLEELTQRAQRRRVRLSSAEVDEFVSLYQRVSAHQSYARTHLRDSALVIRLSRLVADAGGVIYSTPGRNLAGVTVFFRETLPAALWNARAMITISALLFAVPMAGVALWLANSDRALDVAAPEAARNAALLAQFEDYYTEKPATQFATEVFINNIQVSMLAFALGIAFCVGTALVLIWNGVNVGVALGLFVAVGRQGRFWGLILPHGLLELTAVFVAGAAGLTLGWAIISPGDLPRSNALAKAARQAVVLIFGVVVMLAISGVIEGFITGSSLDTATRIGIGALAEAAFLIYMFTLGPPAAAQAGQADVGLETAGPPRPVGVPS